jgi:pilus assembly protein CpaE
MADDIKDELLEDKEAKGHKIDSLLPPAQIHLFSDDNDTIGTFQTLAEDWRFGRINMSNSGSNLDDAITHYSRRKSPTLILIQTEDTGKDFQDKLGSLAEVCNEGTAAIVIGPVNDVQLYRHLTGMGISDYLVKPIEIEQLVEAIATSLQDLVGAVDSHLMAVVGVKGGVGATTISAMIAHTLSSDFKAKTLVLDASGGASTLWNHFAFSPTGTLIEATRAVVDKDEDSFNRLIVKHSDMLHVLNAGAESILDNPVATQAFEMLLDKCLSIYPNVIVDLSKAPVQIIRLVTARANSIGIVATPRVPDLSITKLLLKDLRELPGSAGRNPTIFLNKSGLAKSADISPNDAVEALKSDNIIPVKWDGTLFADAENSGEFIGGSAAYKKISNQLNDAITKMTGHKKTTNDNKSSGGLFSFLTKKGA